MATKRRGRTGNNEGSIRQRPDGTWEGRVSLGYDSEGKPKRQSFYGKTRQEVAEKMNETLHQLHIGSFIEPNKVMLGEWLDTWLATYKKMGTKGIRPTTYVSYEYIIRAHIKPTLGWIPLKQLQTQALQKFFNSMRESGRQKMQGSYSDKPGLSRRTVEYTRTIIKAALSQAVEEGLLIRNVAAATKLPPDTEKKEVVPFTRGEAEQFLSTARGNRMFASYYMDIFTGTRRGETLGLKWDDIDWKAPNFEIKRELVAIKDETTGKYFLDFQLPKTAKSQRTIPMTEDMVKVLKSHKARQNEEKLFFGQSYHDENLVFCSEDGKRLWPRNFNRQYTSLLKQAGIEHKKPHTMRHTCASLLLEAGEELKNVQELLGHSKMSTTGDIYAHVLEKTKKKALDKLNGMINVDLSEIPVRHPRKVAGK
jgi:integrase